MTELRAAEVWRAVLGDLQLQVSQPVYDTWLRGTEAVSWTDDLLYVGVSTPFAIEWLERRMYQTIVTTARRVLGYSVDVRFQVGRDVSKEDGQPRLPQPTQSNGPPPPDPALGVLNSNYTFSRFVVGISNRLPDNAARAVAQAPGHTYNPLFIHSGVGLGKTHLLHAIAHTCASKGVSFRYATSEQFTNEFISSIRNRSTEEFRRKYRDTQVLLMDDIQFINGKEQTQEVFFHTFNELHNSNRQVVLTSDKPPGALSSLEDRLRSRFVWGLVAGIQPPDLETRMAILRRKAEQLKLSLQEEVVDLVARAVRYNVRELEGSLTRIVALSRLHNGPITTSLASQALADLLYEPSPGNMDPDSVVEEVARHYRVAAQDLSGATRRKSISRARHVAMYILRRDVGMKDTDIGRLLGGRAHSTVIAAVAKVESSISKDPQLQKDLLAIKEAILA